MCEQTAQQWLCPERAKGFQPRAGRGFFGEIEHLHGFAFLVAEDQPALWIAVLPTLFIGKADLRVRAASIERHHLARRTLRLVEKGERIQVAVQGGGQQQKADAEKQRGFESVHPLRPVIRERARRLARLRPGGRDVAHAGSGRMCSARLSVQNRK